MPSLRRRHESSARPESVMRKNALPLTLETSVLPCHRATGRRKTNIMKALTVVASVEPTPFNLSFPNIGTSEAKMPIGGRIQGKL